jgi:glycosyltransferase involved in cell wall biosynthesis
MRILHIVVYYLPSTMSCAALIHDLAREFLRMGHEPIVLAPDAAISSDCQLSCEDGITILRVRTGKIKTAGRIVRAFNEIRLSRMVWKRAKKFLEANPCDLVIYYSPPIFWGPLVKKLKRKFACTSYLILGDIFPQWALETGVLRRGVVYWYLKLREKESYAAADIIRVQSPANLRYFEENGLSRKHTLEVLYNWTSLNKSEVVLAGYRSRLGLVDKVVFFYGGNIGIAQDIDNIIRLAEALKNEPRAYFLLVGDGSEVARLRTLITVKGLTNIAIQDAVDYEDYLSMLFEFDIGLISLDRRLRSHNFPGKMMDYMYNSKPILASINPDNDLKEFVETGTAGLVCFNGQDKVFVDLAKRLVADGELRRELGMNGRKLLEEKFSVSKAARQILSHALPQSCGGE